MSYKSKSIKEVTGVTNDRFVELIKSITEAILDKKTDDVAPGDAVEAILQHTKEPAEIAALAFTMGQRYPHLRSLVRSQALKRMIAKILSPSKEPQPQPQEENL